LALVRNLVLSLALVGCANRTVAPRAPVRGLAGCWRFDREYFSVIGRHPATGAPVSVRTADLELLAEAPPPDVFPHDQSKSAVRPIPFVVDTMTHRRWMARSGWDMLGADSVTVSWYNGLYGPIFRLAVTGDSMRGVTRHLSDVVGTPVKWNPAGAVRIDCPAPTGGGR
jgi:hypothetical protein